ncbi:MAG TPA: DJ-1/PfpI/YhbO family deglycase/protease [Patescibacteria group bacterium]|nr:DJ-1/PfpI/YhbO family deglycase/protease [Patescibacteria group bacterium]
MGKQEIPDDTYTPETQNRDADVRVLILTDDNVEDLEFFYPYYRFLEAGLAVDVVTPDGGKFKGKHGLEMKHSKKVTEVDPLEYDLLYIPGGKAPAKLRKDEDVLALVKQFVNGGKTVTTVCHGPQILAAADVIGGRQIAGWPEIEEEITDAGGVYVSEETVVDDQFISGRWPADLPALMAKTLSIIDVISENPGATAGDAEREGAGTRPVGNA